MISVFTLLAQSTRKHRLASYARKQFSCRYANAKSFSLTSIGALDPHPGKVDFLYQTGGKSHRNSIASAKIKQKFQQPRIFVSATRRPYIQTSEHDRAPLKMSQRAPPKYIHLARGLMTFRVSAAAKIHTLAQYCPRKREQFPAAAPPPPREPIKQPRQPIKQPRRRLSSPRGARAGNQARCGAHRIQDHGEGPCHLRRAAFSRHSRFLFKEAPARARMPNASSCAIRMRRRARVSCLAARAYVHGHFG